MSFDALDIATKHSRRSLDYRTPLVKQFMPPSA